MVQVVGEGHSCSGHIEVEKPRLWWPHLMSDTPGHMLEVGAPSHPAAGGACGGCGPRQRHLPPARRPEGGVLGSLLLQVGPGGAWPLPSPG